MRQTTTSTEWPMLFGEQRLAGTAGEVVGPWLAHSIAREASRAPRPAQAGQLAHAWSPEAGAHARLGAATAAPIWGWARPSRSGARQVETVAAEVTRRGATTAPERTELPMAPTLLRAMTEAARATGRSESEVWAEAAREWLRWHTHGDDPQPPEPGASAPHPAAVRDERERCWQAIDVLVNDLRAPQPARPAACSQPEEPAA